MTIQINSCSEIVFNTLEIYNLQLEDVTSLSVQYGKNCAALTTVDLISSKADIYEATENEATGTNFTLTPALLYNDDTQEKFCEGMYYFQWSLTVGSTTYTFSLCALIDCESKIKCKIKDYYLDTNDPTPMFLYNALVFSNDCDECDCEQSCKIYKKLTNLLNLTNVSTDGCGCS